MPIPESIKQQPSWTLSDNRKIPFSPKYLYANPPVYGWKETDNTPLKTYDEVIPFRKMHIDSKATIWLKSNNPFIIVDVEPEGMGIPNNPWLNQPYIYKEYSTNGGLHGILPFKPPEEYNYLKEVPKIKIKQLETEILIHHSFCRFTEDEIDIPNLEFCKQTSNSNQYQLTLAKSLASFKPKERHLQQKASIQLTNDHPKQLSENDLRIFRKTLKKYPQVDYDIDDPKIDASAVELKWANKVAGYIKYQDKKVLNQHDRYIRLVLAVLKELLPERDKHSKTFNHQSYGRISYIEYTAINAVQFIISIQK